MTSNSEYAIGWFKIRLFTENLLDNLNDTISDYSTNQKIFLEAAFRANLSRDLKWTDVFNSNFLKLIWIPKHIINVTFHCSFPMFPALFYCNSLQWGG